MEITHRGERGGGGGQRVVEDGHWRYCSRHVEIATAGAHSCSATWSCSNRIGDGADAVAIRTGAYPAAGDGDVLRPAGLGGAHRIGSHHDLAGGQWVARVARDLCRRHGGWLEARGTGGARQGWADLPPALAHGAGSQHAFHDGALPVAPSAVAIKGDGIHTPIGKQPYETPRALGTGEIPRVIDDYRRAAANARQVGFDGVEVHAANGYLIDQFLQSKTNRRTDAYGGSVVNRCRFLRDVVEAVCSVWPPIAWAFASRRTARSTTWAPPTSASSSRLPRGGADPFGLAYLHVVDGLAFGFHELGSPMSAWRSSAGVSRTVDGQLRLLRQSAEEAITAGRADLIAFGRPFISNPDLVERFAHGWPLAGAGRNGRVVCAAGARGYTDFPTDPAG